MCRTNVQTSHPYFDSQLSMPELAILPEESGDVYERFSRHVNRN
jgi:hypothetical protein